ncbi:hypothetical protein AOQ84DRAFT_47275 [Glonium stellatum]|uniref:Uncharacterized protein n=1 Tax=Glonium stellatum TaxID=574774 RepID=A0A8E2F1C5_9PEZI|nr:hypothetical protein AOQ84DRAFT_47275 [Glonium stellatum]
MSFALNISASTPEQSASRIASLESAFLWIYGFVDVIGVMAGVTCVFAAAFAPFAILFDSDSSNGLRLTMALAIPTVCIIVPSIILMEAGIIRNYLNQMPKDERPLSQLRWLADCTLGIAMALVLLTRYENFRQMGFTILCIVLLFFVWWGLLIGVFSSPFIPHLLIGC